ETAGFSGVVRVDRGDTTEFAAAYGLAHRGYGIANTVDTRFAIASGNKGLTALVVVSLIESGQLGLDTTARSLLGADLPLVDDRVTVEHLLSHRSGIGDYLDEDAGHDVDDYLMPVSVHRLATIEAFVEVLDGFPTKFPPGDRFSYCNGGFVVLALLAERATGIPFPELVRERVTRPAGMADTAFLRSDEQDGRMALGYLGVEGLRTNVLHLPVAGTGDGGIYTTAADLHSFWTALFAGRIVSREWVAEMVRPRSDVPAESMRYGLGFWLHRSRDSVLLVGFDAGVSCRTGHDPATGLTWTVLGNTSGGVWPVARALESELGVGA
ncbi:MAG TPA: serine hydrolase domain-containing protein, partial [Pseudonocardiaceae bacterium]|nr:serine hydrolase domain-containing protein [Pseudonocardiaceae bacterium]